MEQLLSYINAMPPEARSRFAEDAGSSIGYLRKAVCTGQKLGESLCTRIERATGGAVSADFLRPDITWVRVPDPAWPHPGGRPLVDHTRHQLPHEPVVSSPPSPPFGAGFCGRGG